MGMLNFLFGPSEEEFQPTLTDEEMEAIGDQETWIANGGSSDSEDWPAQQAQYSALVEGGVFLEQIGDEWRWNKAKPDEDDDEPEPRKKFLGLF